jgi:hypothetical protein
MERTIMRGAIVLSVIGLVVGLAALAAGYLTVAPMGFLTFELLAIIAIILATTPPEGQAS